MTKKRRSARRTGPTAAVAAVAAALLLSAPGFALPRPYANYLFGPSMIRAEAVLMSDLGALQEYRLDRGTIRGVSGSSVTLRERDGLVYRIPVSAATKVMLNGHSSSFSALRPGMEATATQRGAEPAQRLEAIQPAFARHRTLGRYFGPSMLRAETVLRTGGVNHEFRIDRGRLKGIVGSTITLRGRDGVVVQLEVAPNAQIELNRRFVLITALRRGMEVTAIRKDGEPAEALQATVRR